MARLRPGDVRIDRDGADPIGLFVTGGFVEVQPRRVTVLADLAYRGEQLEAAAAAARELAAHLGDRQLHPAAAEQLERTLIEAAARYRLARRLGGGQRG
jgi:F-type H+-transporting ATPase subunit epsilon